MLRRLGFLDDALSWYEACLAINPTNAELHAHIAFTLHLSRRYAEAIDEYHKSLAIRHSPFCAEMLSRAMNDFVEFSSDITEDLGSPGFGMREKSHQPVHLDFAVDAL